MGFLSSLLGGLFGGSGVDDLGCDWYCDGCGDNMNEQSGFTASSGVWTCAECGCVNDVTEDNIRYGGEEELNEHPYRYCCGIQHDADEVACRSCGDYF